MRRLLILLPALFSAAALGADWTQIIKTDDVAVYASGAPARFLSPEQGIKMARFRFVYAELRDIDGHAYRIRDAEVLAECPRNRLMFMDRFFFDDADRMVLEKPFDAGFRFGPVKADAVEPTLFERICNGPTSLRPRRG